MKSTELEINISKLNPDLYVIIDKGILDIEVASVNDSILVDTAFLNKSIEIEINEHVSSVIVEVYKPYTIEVQVEKNNPNLDIEFMLLEDYDNFEDFESSDGLFLLRNDYFLKVKKNGI